MLQDNMPEWTVDDWRRLIPELAIGKRAAGAEIGFTDAALSEISDSLWEYGYFTCSPVFAASDIAPIETGMKRLAAVGLPPVYIYLYDEPWQIAAKLGALVRHFLGESFAILPNLWAWHLAKDGETGWPLHRDCSARTVFGKGPAAVLLSLSLWLPITDADERNGCMYVVPKSGLNENGEPSSHAMAEIALPARAGSVLGWRQDLLHRGGRFGPDAVGPRLSLSFEFQNRAFDPLVEPLIDPGSFPDFSLRDSLIRAQFAKYRHIDPAACEGK